MPLVRVSGVESNLVAENMAAESSGVAGSRAGPVSAGAPADFVALVDREFPALVATATLLVGSSALAEELVQDCLLRTYVRWSHVRRLDAPGAWVRRIVINASLSGLRRRRSELKALRAIGRSRPEPVPGSDDEFVALIASLPRDMKVAVALRYGADMSVAEVAAATESTEAATRSLLYRARARMREELEAGADEQEHPHGR